MMPPLISKRGFTQEERAVARVAEKQPALVDELAHRGDVAAAVHDGEFGLRQLVDGVELALVAQVGACAQDLGEVG